VPLSVALCFIVDGYSLLRLLSFSMSFYGFWAVRELP
jgi:hypothetical protein